MPKKKASELIRMRNEAICRRYHYWTEVQRLRFDDALRILSREEFFLGEYYIMSIIRRTAPALDDVSVKSVPKVRKPRISARQLELFDHA